MKRSSTDEPIVQYRTGRWAIRHTGPCRRPRTRVSCAPATTCSAPRSTCSSRRPGRGDPAPCGPGGRLRRGDGGRALARPAGPAPRRLRPVRRDAPPRGHRGPAHRPRRRAGLVPLGDAGAPPGPGARPAGRPGRLGAGDGSGARRVRRRGGGPAARAAGRRRGPGRPRGRRPGPVRPGRAGGADARGAPGDDVVAAAADMVLRGLP